MESEHRKRVETLKSEWNEWKGRYDEIVNDILAADKVVLGNCSHHQKVTRRTKYVATLEKRAEKLRAECTTTIASAYLTKKANHLVFDYVYPSIFEVLVYADKRCVRFSSLTPSASFISTHLQLLWSQLTATEAYTTCFAFVQTYWKLCVEKTKEYWNLMIGFIHTKWNIDIAEVIKATYLKIVHAARCRFQVAFTPSWQQVSDGSREGCEWMEHGHGLHKTLFDYALH